MGLQKYKRTRWHDDDALLFFWMDAFVSLWNLCKMGLQKYKWHDDDALLFSAGWMRLYRGKIFARWVYPYTNARDDMTTMRCFFLLDGCVCIRARNPRFYFVHAGTKPGFLPKSGIKNRGFRALVCIFVKYLQDGFTKLQTHAMTWLRCVAFFFWMDAFV